MPNHHFETMHWLHSFVPPVEGENEITIPLFRLTIALSREPGVPIEEVVREVSIRLGWAVYDREMLERIADTIHCSLTVLEQVDEKHRSWLLECLGGFACPGLSQSEYTCRLVRLIESLGVEGHCIIVGRGAACILSWHSTLRIHLVGDIEDRIAAFGRQHHLDRLQAERCIREIDWEQSRFIRDYFGTDPAKPRNYDLILNTSELSVAECANLVLHALRRKALASIWGRVSSSPTE